MRKTLQLILLIYAVLVLSACGGTGTIPETTLAETTAVITTAPTEGTTTPPTEAPVTDPPEASTIAVTEPEHSQFYVPELSAEDLIRYFNEVCLDAEFTFSGDSTLLQKWGTPIYYCVQGSPTDEDLAVLGGFIQRLNTIHGFPGIFQTDDPLSSNLNFHFCTQSEMITLMGDWCSDLDGAVTFWYDDNRIYDAIICCRTDLNQTLRNSVILEELYNGLGPIQDTSLREDSIIYAGYSEPQALTEIDWLILQLLYHPDLQFGMDTEACAEVIRQLYY